MSFLESTFEFLFKYRPHVFRQGDLALTASWPVVVVTLILATVAVAALLRYRLIWGQKGLRDRIVLSSLRIAALGVIVFCLLQPALVLSVVVPQQSFLGVLLDDSKSMLLTDQDDRTRGALLQRSLDPEGGALLKDLAERFKVRLFGFSADARRLDDVSELRFAGTETHLGPALVQVADELAAVPLAGLVVLSDGADTSRSSLADTLLELRARGVPIFTVGVGRDRFAKDIEITRVDAPRSVLKGSSVVVEVVISQVGFGGSRVLLDVEDSGRIVNSKEIRFPVGGEAALARVHFTASDPGPRLFRFRVPPRPGEAVSQNNEQTVLIVVKDRREKILYFEGEPRFELKFLRRAVADDENIQLVCLQRTAENKYLRLEIESPDELGGGFPTSREELFHYRALVVGSVEASFFTYDQMRMIADFVGERGAGFLMLGGRRSFAEGGFAGTPVADLLPVVLGPPPREGDQPFFTELKVGLTPYGRTHPATQLASDEQESARRWQSLPPVSTLNPLTRLKPGATSLLTGDGEGLRGKQIVLAHQRYGRGRALALTVHDSWQWQMHADIPVDDMTHETLWRQLLRWLVSYVPDQLTVSMEKDQIAPGAGAVVVAEVRDETYLAVNNAEVTAEVREPDGDVLHVPLEWTVDRDGEYRGSFVPLDAGLYDVQVDARRGDTLIAAGTGHLDVGDLASEYFDAEMRSSLLKRIAEQTGGRFYTPRTMRQLAEDVAYSDSGSTILEHRDLWDMPILFLLLIALLGAEWAYRRARGLV